MLISPVGQTRSRAASNSVTLAIALAAMAAALSGCGGGGGGGGSTSPTPQAVQGTVSAPGGSLPASGAVAHAALASVSVTPVSGVTVTVGTVTVNGDGTATFAPMVGATATTAADGTFSITLPIGTALTADMVVVASNGPAPTTLPAPNVLVCPIVSGKLSVDPVTTEAHDELCKQIAANGESLHDADKDLIEDFLHDAEGACGSLSSGSLAGLRDIIKLKIEGDATTGITLSGVILEIQRKNHHATGTLTSDGDFTVGTDTNSNTFNGTSTAFTADHVGVTHRGEGTTAQIIGQQTPASTTGTFRRFAISLPSSGAIAAGSYTATVSYSEDTFNGSPTSHEAESGDDHFGNGTVKVWSATSVPVTIAAATTPATSSSTGTTYNVTVSSATYSPVSATAVAGKAQGTLTTSLTGTLVTTP